MNGEHSPKQDSADFEALCLVRDHLLEKNKLAEMIGIVGSYEEGFAK